MCVAGLLMAVLVGATQGGWHEQNTDDGRMGHGNSDTADLGTDISDEVAIIGELAVGLRDDAGGIQESPEVGQGDGSVLSEPEPLDGPEPSPEAVLEPVETLAPSGEGVDAICAVFGSYCADALAVALCESGPDYYAPPAYYHTGTFQLAFAYHAGKFAAHGWDMWATGDDVYQNSVIAFEIFSGRGYSWLGTSGWPVCGWRAGY